MLEMTMNEMNINDCDQKQASDARRNLTHAEVNTSYFIRSIESQDEELVHFLFTLGCYAGESITVISVLAENFVINIKDARYSIDRELAEAIRI